MILRKRLISSLGAIFMALVFVLTTVPVLFTPRVQAACTDTAAWHAFLYKFQSNWTDAVAWTDTGTYYLYVLNPNYSRVERYTVGTSPFSLTYSTEWGAYGNGSGQLKQPQGIAVDNATGTFFIADTGNNRVVRYNSSGTQTGEWSSLGGGLGTLSGPTGVATDGTFVFVTDTGNNRIVRINTGTGAAIAQSTAIDVAYYPTYGPMTFSSPRGIAYYDAGGGSTYVYVADTGNNRILRFNSTDLTFSASNSVWGSYGTGNGQFNQPQRITVVAMPSVHLFVSDTTTRLQRFNDAGTYTASTTISQGVVSVVAGQYNDVYALVPFSQTNRYIGDSFTYDTAVVTESQLPVDLSVDSSNNVYLYNSRTNTIQKFSSNFTPIGEWNGGTLGAFGTSGSLGGARGIGVNSGGEVVVADSLNNVVKKYSSTGVPMTTIVPSPPITPFITPFVNPSDVANEATGKLYVADTDNDRLIKFDSAGLFMWQIATPTPTLAVLPGPGTPTPTPPLGSFYHPYGVTVGPTNDVYVADTGFHRIQKINANGTPQRAWGQFGSADGLQEPQFDTPQGMAIDSSENIYVADTGNNRLQRFDNTGGNQICWGAYGTGDGQFDQPRNITLDSAARIYVSEVGNKRVQVFGTTAQFAGFTVTESGGTNVTEGSTIDSYTIKMNTQPVGNVDVTVVPDSAQVTVSSSTLTFTPYNWNIPQTVTVIPVHDYIAEDTHTSTITHTVSATGSDPLYANLKPSDIVVHITDIDVAGVHPSVADLGTITEGGAGVPYTVVLNSKPTANVTISLFPSGFSALSVTPSTLTFSSTDWNVPQTVTVTATDNNTQEGSKSILVEHQAESTDPVYNLIAPDNNVTGTVTDINVAGVTVSPLTTHSVSEDGTNSTFTVKLNSIPEGGNTVAINFSPDVNITLSPSSLTFDDTNWNAPQSVTVAAVHDFVVNTVNPRPATASAGITSSDSYYSALSIADIHADVTDIDYPNLVFAESGGATQVIEGNSSSTDTYTMQLTSKPTANVTVNLDFTNAHEATTAAVQYVFTPLNWNTPKTATVSAINNDIDEGTHSGTLTHTITSTDPNYSGMSRGLSVSIIEASYADIIITQPNGTLNVTEASVDDTYYVKLNSQPTSPVTVTITGPLNQATASPNILTFDNTNWYTDQTVTVSGVNDYIVEGPHTGSLLHTATSVDTKYNGKTKSVTINITDDDSTVPGVAITQTGEDTTVYERTLDDSYTIVLTSRPTANVKIKVYADNGYATASASLYTFTNLNWNTPQTVSIRAKADPAITGNRTTVFNHIATSTDAHYNNISVDGVIITVVDTDHTTPASPPVCTATAPYGVPDLFQINATQTTAKLYFTPIRDNISYYYIAYGVDPDEVLYGASFQQGPYDGVLNYTVNALNAGTKYYFKIRGGNGCATGNWGNSMYAVTVASNSGTLNAQRIYYKANQPVIGGSAAASSGGASGGSVGGAPAGAYFGVNLYPGSRGPLVLALQQFLNADGYLVAGSGPGSPGNETDFYGPLTTSAVRRFQEAHAAQILAPLGYTSGTGILGPSTRAYINSGGR